MRQLMSLESIEAVIVAEKSASLGIFRRRLERALKLLREASNEERPARRDEASEMAWNFLTQRELIGLRDREQVIADLAIPTEVMARIGAVRRKS